MTLKRYLRLHLWIFLACAGFGALAFLSIRVLEKNVFHCVMHEALHLYCPLCGGTRMFLSLLSFDIGLALRLNPVALFLGAFLVAWDIVTFIRLCRGRPIAAPRALLLTCASALIAFCALRNSFLLFGVDPVGDLSPFWQGRLPLVPRLFACALFFVIGGAILFLVGVIPMKKARFFPLLFFTLALLVFCALALTQRPLVLLLLLPVSAGALLWFLVKRRARP